MTQTKGIDWGKTSFVVGTRTDVAPRPIPQPAFTRQCDNCQQDTLTEIQYPNDVSVVCNVCAGDITAQIEQDAGTQLMYDLPIAFKVRLLDEAQRLKIPVEVVMKRFVEWKLGRPTKASLYNKTVTKKAKR